MNKLEKYPLLNEISAGATLNTVKGLYDTTSNAVKAVGRKMSTPNTHIKSVGQAVGDATWDTVSGDVKGKATEYAIDKASPYVKKGYDWVKKKVTNDVATQAGREVARQGAKTGMIKTLAKGALKYGKAIGMGVDLGIEGGKALIQGAHDQGDIATIDANKKSDVRNENFSKLMSRNKDFQDIYKNNRNEMYGIVRTYLGAGKFSERQKQIARSNPEINKALRMLQHNEKKTKVDSIDVHPLMRFRSNLAKSIQHAAGKDRV